MSTNVSNMTLRDHIVSKKNGSLLITGYSLYITQLIISLTDENSNIKTVLTEIIVFMALLALREYKKHNPSIQNSCTQYDTIDEEQPALSHSYQPPQVNTPVAAFNNPKPKSYPNPPQYIPPRPAVPLSKMQGIQVCNLPPIRHTGSTYII